MSKQEKRCPRCQETKPRSEFYKAIKRYDGVQGWCKICKSAYHASPEYDIIEHRYDASLKGQKSRWKARTRYSYPTMLEEEIRYWLEVVFHPDTVCSICGLKNSQKEMLKRSGFTMRAITQRLSLDHLDCNSQNNSRDNLRICCIYCNGTRSDAMLTDEQVKNKAMRYWEQRIPNKWLWWASSVLRKKGTNEIPACSR